MRITLQLADEYYDYEFDERQKISSVLSSFLKSRNSEINIEDVKAIKLHIDSRTVDIHNTFVEVDVHENEIISLVM